MDYDVKCKYCNNAMDLDSDCNPFTGMKYLCRFVCKKCWSSSPPQKHEDYETAVELARQSAR